MYIFISRRSTEDGAFDAQLRDTGVGVCRAGIEQDGDARRRQLIRLAHAENVGVLPAEEADENRVTRAAFRSRRLSRQNRLGDHGTCVQGRPH